jgi:hypothetical protein
MLQFAQLELFLLEMKKRVVGLHRIQKQNTDTNIFTHRSSTILNDKNTMKFTTRINDLQQPANVGGLRRGEGGVAIEGSNPSFLGCAMSQRHR